MPVFDIKKSIKQQKNQYIMKEKVIIFILALGLITLPFFNVNADKAPSYEISTKNITVERENGVEQLLYITIKLSGMEISGVDGPFDLTTEQLEKIKGGKVTNRVLIGPFPDDATRQEALNSLNQILALRTP